LVDKIIPDPDVHRHVDTRPSSAQAVLDEDDSFQELDEVMADVTGLRLPQPLSDDGQDSFVSTGAGTEVLRQVRSHRSAVPASEALQDAADALSGIYPRSRATMIIEQEWGQWLRATHRIPIKGDGLGTNHQSVMKEIDKLVSQKPGKIVVIPSRRDSAFVGPSGYVDGDRPNPYTWLAVLPHYTKPGQVVWEMGATTWPSCEAAARVHGLPWALSDLPATADSVIRVRETWEPAWVEGLDISQPDVVLVPIPQPLDSWSRYQHRRLWEREVFDAPDSRRVILADSIWNHEVKDRRVNYPEFADDILVYLRAVRSRLRAIDQRTPAGTLVITTAREKATLPLAVRKLIRKEFDWHPVAQHVVLERGGTRSLGDGTPLDAQAVAIWRTQ